MNFGIADIFDRVRRHRPQPLRRRIALRSGSTARIENYFPVAIAANEIARALHVNDARSFMRVHGHRPARRDADIENADAFIFQ